MLKTATFLAANSRAPRARAVRVKEPTDVRIRRRECLGKRYFESC
jgi:hypothetical protein